MRHAVCVEGGINSKEGTSYWQVRARDRGRMPLRGGRRWARLMNEGSCVAARSPTSNAMLDVPPLQIHTHTHQVEVALPWSLLRQTAGGRRVPPQAGDAWRINFSRCARSKGGRLGVIGQLLIVPSVSCRRMQRR